MAEIQLKQFNNEDDDEFYEKIEAPKFVDFTVPDLSRPDDRSWFCLRIGCDQKHEEEMDPDALYRSFKLRVMAARSPNIRLQKALSRQTPLANAKCPLSAPAKSSKSRIPRLTAITMVSQKMNNNKLKVHPISKLNSTPNVKAKQSSVSAKALTTPRYKKSLSSPNPFRSVQNPRTIVSVPKNRVAAKALVFQTPKKNERTKTSLQSCTPVTEICAGVKKLEITSQRKNVSGHSRVIPSRYNTVHAKKSVLNSNPSRPLLSARKVKTRTVVSFVSQDSNSQVAKSSRSLKSKTKGNSQKFHGSMFREEINNDSSDMEIDGKSRDGSLEVCSVADSSKDNEKNGHEEHLVCVQTSEKLGATTATREESFSSSERSPIKENPFSVSMNISSCNGSSLSNSEEEKNLEAKDLPEFHTSKVEEDLSDQGSGGDKENVGCNPEWKDSNEDDLPICQTSKGASDEYESMESDDKENAFTVDDNRETNLNIGHSERKVLSRNEAHDKSQKATRVLDKTFKECSASATTGVQGVKYKKAKPTNPKPFRLRTEERGILKEANLEKRLHLLTPLKETATVQRFPSGSSQRKHGNKIQKKELSERKHEHDEGNQIESEKRVQQVQTQKMRPAYLKTSKQSTEANMASTTPHRQKLNSVSTQLRDCKETATQNTKSTSENAKSPLLRQQHVRPQRIASATKGKISLASPTHLGAIKETTSTISQPKEAAEQTEKGSISNNAVGAARPSSRGRRPATVPKEPYFHSIHVPKSCTKKLATAIP